MASRAYNKALKTAAVLSQLLTLYPFVVVTEASGYGRYTAWHYPALFAVFGAFYAIGRLCGHWARSGRFSRRTKPLALFASRAAVAVPTAAYVTVCLKLLPSPCAALYFYAPAAAIIAFFGGHHTTGLDYSDIFSRGWFAFYFAAALIAELLLWFDGDKTLLSDGGYQLAVVFGVLIMAAALLSNQTNIDTRVNQRGAGRSVLPTGLRGYNTKLIAAVGAATVGLFLFAKPIARFISGVLGAIIGFLLSLIQRKDPQISENETEKPDMELSPIPETDNTLFTVLEALLAVGLIVLAVRYRKEILRFFKDLFAPLFRESGRGGDLPFADEVSDSAAKRKSSRSLKKTEQQLLRQFHRESDPRAKFRCGYSLFLMRLARTPFAQLPSDTTTVQEEKGELAFRRGDLNAVVGAYNGVRYGEAEPTSEELSLLETVIDETR